MFSVILSIILSGCLDNSKNESGLKASSAVDAASRDTDTDHQPVDADIHPPSVDRNITPTTYNAILKSSGEEIIGDVTCNYNSLKKGTFSVNGGDTFTCTFGSVELGQFTAKEKTTTVYSTDVATMSFDLKDIYGDNVTKVLNTVSSCHNNNQICLSEIDSFDITDIYNQLGDNTAVTAYLKSEKEKATDKVGHAPSSHNDSNVVPAVSGGSNDLNSKFVTSTAEAALTYKPSPEAQVLTRSKLIDENGTPIAGMSFFSPHSTGKTDANGEFEYLWGDKLIFSIDTFEFGSLIGNQVNYKLTDVSANPVTKANIQALLERYGTVTANTIEISDNVRDVFSHYPNVINELINLNLPNGAHLEGSSFNLPNEFEAQFDQGLASLIDKSINSHSVTTYSSHQAPTLSLNNGKFVSNSLNAIFKGVNTFHVFNDNKSYYGASGYTRGMRTLNMSNRAFPIMMPRKDINREIPFGQAQAWTREGKPYIVDWPNVKMPSIPLVSKDTATFGFPFVTAGSIGKGKVVFMGNGLYLSVLSCPESYWANRQLRIDSKAQECTTTIDASKDPRNDHGSMQKFFGNLFNWLAPQIKMGNIAVATNIKKATSESRQNQEGNEYDFFISPKYGFLSVEKLSKDGFQGISVADTPILILQGYQTKLVRNGQTSSIMADLDNTNLSQDDITALIQYVNEGGNVLFMDAIDKVNPEPLARLADAAGVSLGGSNVTPTNQASCGSSYYCPTEAPNLHVNSQYDMVVLERFPDAINTGKRPYRVKPDGSIDWDAPIYMPKLEIPTYEIPKLDKNGTPVLDKDGVQIKETKFARIFVKNEKERAAAITELKQAFSGTKQCTNNYEYEVDCIETRKGDGIDVYGAYGRKDFDRYPVSPAVIESMIKSANLGSNIKSLMKHELYYRTKGKQGVRLSSNELNQIYDNLSVWLWNDNDYAYDSTTQDELGFKTVVSYLNCYTDDKHGHGSRCPADLKATLIANHMLHGAGELAGQMNPSYPLNYAEKPLTRIMLGRSFWDHDITVDTSAYPGRSTGTGLSESVDIETAGKAVSFSAGNNQPTGLWAPQLQDVTVTGGVEATITVMMADDLTGRPQHEVGLNRPPRMQMSFNHDGSFTTFKVPYGGLITIKPTNASLNSQSTVETFNFSGVEKAALWKEGQWINTLDEATAPIAEIDTGNLIYTTSVKNLESADLDKFSKDMNKFSNMLNDFYGRDEISEKGKHRRYTYPVLSGFRHRFVDDVQISIGAGHSGYPVMHSGFNANATDISLEPLSSWLLWHEVGHNLATAPFTAPGSTEVSNNILALYVQESVTGEMGRIKTDIQKAPLWLNQNSGHAWSNANAGLRLVMFSQLKIWAKKHFKIDAWYDANDHKPTIYNADNGWNMFKLMHRKARGDTQGDNLGAHNGTNYCSSSYTKLRDGDLMMVCSSYVSGYDLSEFFTTWNVGETSSTTPEGNKSYSGGITNEGLDKLAELKLSKPTKGPLSIHQL